MPRRKSAPEIPCPDAFRKWLGEALTQLEVKPATCAKAIGASVNSVGTFLRDPERDITLSRAAIIERYLRKIARDRGATLPAISRRAHNQKGPKDG